MTIKPPQTYSSFFKFANYDNPSLTDNIKINETQHVMIPQIYARCTNCNASRFKVEDLAYVRSGTNGYFCDPCLYQFIQRIHADKNGPQEDLAMGERICHSYLYKAKAHL